MKLNTVVGFLSLLLVISYFLVMKIEVDEFDDMARFIPSTALLYLEQDKAKIIFTQFEVSPLGRTLKKIDFKKTGAKIGLRESWLEGFSGVHRLYDEAKDNALFHEMLGKRFSISLLAPLQMDAAIEGISFMEENAVLICQPLHNAKFLEFLIEKYLKYSYNDLATRSQYGNHMIHRLVNNGEIISFARIDGLFIFSFNENQLRLCIDTFDEEQPSLKYNKAFNKVRMAAEKANRLIFLPLNNIRTVVAKLLEDLEFIGQTLIEKELMTTQGFTGLGYVTWNNKKSVENTIIATYEKKTINPVVQRYLRVAPQVNKMYTFTSKKPMVYYWSNTFDLSYLLDYYIKKEDSDGAVLHGFQSEIEKITGKQTREIISFLGDQVSVVVEPAKKGSYFELPLGLVVWQTKNSDKLQQILEKIVAHYGIPTVKKKYGPVAYNYWSQAPEDGIFPLYGFWKDYFFLGNSLTLFRKVVDNNAASLSLTQQREVKSVDPGFSLENNSVTYTDNKQLFHVIQELLNLVSTLIAIEDKNNAGKFRIIVEEIINPLLNGAAMYERNGTRSYFTNDMVIIKSKTIVAKQKRVDE